MCKTTTTCSPALAGCTFTGNSAYVGGGMYSDNSSPTLENCTFSNNSADIGGGGMYNLSTSSPTLTDTTVCGNTPDQIYGDWIDNGGNTVTDECPEDCPADFNDDGEVDAADLGLLLSAWDTTEAQYDIDGDGVVGGGDLGTFLVAWGACP